MSTSVLTIEGVMGVPSLRHRIKLFLATSAGFFVFAATFVALQPNQANYLAMEALAVALAVAVILILGSIADRRLPWHKGPPQPATKIWWGPFIVMLGIAFTAFGVLYSLFNAPQYVWLPGEHRFALDSTAFVRDRLIDVSGVWFATMATVLTPRRLAGPPKPEKPLEPTDPVVAQLALSVDQRRR